MLAASSSTTPLRRIVFLLMAVALAACDAADPNGGNPDPNGGGNPDPTPSMPALLVDFSSIEVIKDCDGIEGDGDFSFLVTATTSTGQTHTAYSGSRTMGEGDVFSNLTDVRFEFTATDGHQVDVTFRATETDQPIVGPTYPDDRMDGRLATGTHRFNEGAWSSTGALTLTNGSSDCEVRLYYAALPE